MLRDPVHIDVFVPGSFGSWYSFGFSLAFPTASYTLLPSQGGFGFSGYASQSREAERQLQLVVCESNTVKCSVALVENEDYMGEGPTRSRRHGFGRQDDHLKCAGDGGVLPDVVQ